MATLKFVVVGDSGVGKTSLGYRFLDNQFFPVVVPTIGIAFRRKEIDVGGKKFVEVWDTLGQERFRALNRAYFRGAHACMIVYDISNRNSFINVLSWLSTAKADANSADTVYLLVGNKSDLASEERQVSSQEALTLALEEDMNMIFIETSAKTGDGVEEAFLLGAKEVVRRMEEGFHGTANLAHLEGGTESSSSCFC